MTLFTLLLQLELNKTPKGINLEAIMKVKKYVILFIYCVSWTLVYASKQWSLESEDNQAYDAVTFLAKYNDDKFDLSSQAEEKKP